MLLLKLPGKVRHNISNFNEISHLEFAVLIGFKCDHFVHFRLERFVLRPQMWNDFSRDCGSTQMTSAVVLSQLSVTKTRRFVLFPLYPLSLRKHRCMFCVKVHLLRHLLVFYKNNCDEGLCSCVGLSRPIMPSFPKQQVRKKKSFFFATKRHREARTQGMLTIWWNLKSCQGPVLNCRGGRKRWVFLFGIPANRAGPDES